MSKFIVLDGPDGSGTTTHCGLLRDYLSEKGYDVLFTAEPSKNLIGKFIRDILNRDQGISGQALQLLFTADRSEHLSEVILPALEEGRQVICDRYHYSTVCYGLALGLEEKWLNNIGRLFLKPDHTIFLLPPLEVSLERIDSRINKESLESEGLQKRVHEAYLKIAKKDNIPVVDSAQDAEKTKNDILRLVKLK